MKVFLVVGLFVCTATPMASACDVQTVQPQRSACLSAWSNGDLTRTAGACRAAAINYTDCGVSRYGSRNASYLLQGARLWALTGSALVGLNESAEAARAFETSRSIAASLDAPDTPAGIEREAHNLVFKAQQSLKAMRT